MSTRSMSEGHTTRLELPTTPEYLKPLQQLVLRWSWKVTHRRDVIPTIIPTRLGINMGAPARFQPATAQIHVPEEAFAHLDASSYDNVDEFIVREPSLAGRFVHEFMHAAHSPDLQFLKTYHRDHDGEHIEALSTLLEGHCESQGWDALRKIEQTALTTTVFDVVLESMVDENGEIDLKSPRSAAALLGLIAARVEKGIIDVSQPNASVIYVNTVAALGEYFEDFWNIAIKFADVQVAYYTDYEIKMVALLDEWVDLLRSFIENSDYKEKEEPQDGEEGEEGEEDGEPKGGKSKKGEEEGEDEGTGKQEGHEQGESDDDDQSGGTLSTTENDGSSGFGAYASANMSESSFSPAALEEAVKGLQNAAREQHENTNQMIRQNVTAVHEATAQWHSQRREWNRDWSKEWH